MDAIIPLVRGKGSQPRTNDVTRLPAATDRRTKNTKKAVPWLSPVARVVSGMFYSVVANRRQPSGVGGGAYIVQLVLYHYSKTVVVNL